MNELITITNSSFPPQRLSSQTTALLHLKNSVKNNQHFIICAYLLNNLTMYLGRNHLRATVTHAKHAMYLATTSIAGIPSAFFTIMKPVARRLNRITLLTNIFIIIIAFILFNLFFSKKFTSYTLVPLRCLNAKYRIRF